MSLKFVKIQTSQYMLCSQGMHTQVAGAGFGGRWGGKVRARQAHAVPGLTFMLGLGNESPVARPLLSRYPRTSYPQAHSLRHSVLGMNGP